MSNNLNEQKYYIDDLWNAYQEDRNPEIREKLVHVYLSLVNIIAGRIAISLPAYVDRDDLISCGFFGLLDAIERYEPTRGNKFETYAGVRIRGAILDSLRAKDWLPVSLRQKIRKYEHVVSELEANFGRAATDQEIADKLGVSVNDLSVLLNQLNVATVIPLEEYVKSEPVRGTTVSPSDNIEHKVVSLYYYDELTLKEISLILKLSEARISQLHTKAVFRMRGYLSRIKSSLI
ncbi:MAG: polymerase, sigma 28 subunit, FliA/WhiG [Bacillus sp. (in: firmicutes)]|nr:polymerase, sigma 28 subunit, FliA/WhiG [Bacillus sp. (in: firmicutes)]